jgi:predicted kinase
METARALWHRRSVEARLVVLMSGLPAAGKTTTAGRLHAALGGLLIRSCDVYADLGISLPDWVRRTRGFTERVDEYARLRDAAYAEMARRLDAGLAAGTGAIVLDAVHGEPAKRASVYAACRARGASPVVVWCRCDDAAEIERRVASRRGRDGEPEHEASDLSVVRHLTGLWRDPPDDPAVPVIAYDTRGPWVAGRSGPPSPLADRVAAALASSDDGTMTPAPPIDTLR